ncbi:MAG: translation initiation factor [Chloroflexi bacterium]|nr:translation initiation factor [Chloroflexota bacterium]
MGKQKRRDSDLPQGEVWLFDRDGADLGFVPAAEALALAQTRGLDLERLDQLSSPPRYGLRDAGAHEAESARAARIARGGEAKEIRIRVSTGAADLETRKRSAASLLGSGYRVKIRIELDVGKRSDPAPARAILDGLVKSLVDVGHPEARPQSEKGAVAVTLAPV